MATDPGQDSFQHYALIHHSRDEYLRGVLGLIDRGLAAGEPVMVIAPPDRLELISGHLNGHGRAIEFVDITEFGRNPAWIIPALQRRLEPQRERRVHMVCEPLWPGRSPEEIEEVLLHEALSNAAFAEHSISALCPFDAEAFEADVIDEARRTHRLLAADGHKTTSPDFSEQLFRARLQRPLARLPVRGRVVPFSASELGALRSFIAEQGTAAGLKPARSADLVFAVNELATNSIRHGGGSGELELWTTPDRVVAEVRDPGRIADPLVGRVIPDETRLQGLGLWLVNQMCDLVQLRSGESGTTVRVHLNRESAPDFSPVGG